MLSNVVQIIGITLVSAGAFLISIPAGFIVSGILTAIIGISLERD